MSSLFILIPLFSLMILNLLPKGLARRAAFWVALLLLVAELYLVMSPIVGFRNIKLNRLAYFFNFHLIVDDLSLLMLLSISIVVFVLLFAANHLISDERRRFYFINILLIELAGMNGVVMVRDIFSLYVFLEITAVSSFILIAFDKERDSLEGAFKYIIFSAVASVFMFSSIALILLLSGDTGFLAIKDALAVSPHSRLIMIAIGVFLGGIFMKAGLVPFHGWLPDAYSEAPAPVSVLLAGIVTKTLGVYSLMRIFRSVFGFDNSVGNILMFVGAISIIWGALAALTQTDFKRMLAYSSISQVGYIVLGFGSGTVLGMAGAVFHLFNHAIFKSLLFVNSAAVEHETGTRDMERMSGLASKMPVTGAASAIACLSTAGVPPLAGFWSKLIIIVALWQSGHHVYAVVAVLASLLTLAYMLSIQRKVFFGKLKEGFEGVKEAGFGLVFPAVILAVITVAVGIFFPFVLNTFILPISRI
ncbi:MAG: NADH-quinone oxidoreductase subunit M [Candidatus Omnitrophica bacterium]|nr:NADH-quinone oxidoreductase subunit M [Candidatus Omnitrophota bacterium]